MEEKEQTPQLDIDDLIKKYETETKDKLPEVPAETPSGEPAGKIPSRPAPSEETTSVGMPLEPGTPPKKRRFGKAPLFLLLLLLAAAGYWSWNRFAAPGKKSKAAEAPAQALPQAVPLTAEPSIPPVRKEDGIPILGSAGEVQTTQADGIMTKSYRVKAKLDEVQLFYQKELTGDGFLILAGQSLRDRSLAFRKGMDDLYLSLKQLGDEVGIVLSYKVH